MTARVTLLTCCRWQRRSSGTILLLACKVDVVDDVNEVSDAGIDDSSVERWLFLYWKPCRILGAEFRVVTRSFIFSIDEKFSEEKNNPRGSSLSQKFSFLFRVSFFRWRQNLLLYHMYHFWCRWWEQSRPEPYLFLSTSILQGRMTSWDWSLQRQYWKLFNWSFRGWRWSGRRCASRILIVE